MTKSQPSLTHGTSVAKRTYINLTKLTTYVK
jgi:hypothetical protein